MRLSGGQSELLNTLTEQHFDVDSLERLVRFKCDRDLKTIDAFQSKKSGIFRLVETSEKEGWLPVLVKALSDARPSVPEFLQLYESLNRPSFSDTLTKNAHQPTPIQHPTADSASDRPQLQTGPNADAAAIALSGRQSVLLGAWYGAQMQGVGPKGGSISYPLRLQIGSISPEISGIFRFTFKSEDKSLDESIDFTAEFINDRFLRVLYCDEKSGKVQLGVLLLELSDDGLELTGFDVGYGYSSGRIATAQTVLRKQPILIDPVLDRMQRGSVPQTWATRAAFMHPKAARYWQTRAITLENESAAIGTYISLLAPLDDVWDLMISCGPGDAIVDRKLVTALAGRVKQYVPIDISQGACKAAVHSIAAMCPVPIGIVADLEDGVDFIRCALEQCNPGCLLVICTGNLIGNLDLGERNLLENLSSLTRSGDSILLSFATGAFDGPADRATFDASVRWDDLEDLICCGLENITGQDWQPIRQNLSERIDVRAGSSDVPGATGRQLYDRHTNRAALMLRRYEIEKFTSWVRARFPFQPVKSVQAPTSDASVGIGSILLKRI